MSNPTHPLRFVGRLIRAVTLLTGILALPALTWAGDISGVVIDTNSGSFLRGADVRIAELGRATSTGRSGDFRFVNVPGGAYTVTVNFIGYAEVSQTVQVPESGTATPRIAVGSEVVELEEFRVEGYREGKSLALQQKKTSDNIRDILSADSVGQLPDRNVADALVRLPGVSVDMDQGEGRFVAIRGMAPSLNNVTINGATTANPGVAGRNGRAMPLDVIGSAQISQLEVIKTLTPDMDAQGLGGTVEIKTPSAFDKEKGFFLGSFEGGIATEPDDSPYRGEVSYGNRFGPDKKLGIALSANYEWRPYKNDRVDIRWDQDDFPTDYDNDGIAEGEVADFAYPADLEVVPEFGNRQRIGFTARIEYKPNEDTEFYINTIYNQFTEWENGIEITNEGDRLDYDDDQAYLEDAGLRSDRLVPFLTSPTTGYFPTVDAIQHRIGVNKTEQALANVTFGGKKHWGNLTLNAELTYSYAKEEDIFNNQIQFRGRFDDNEMVLREGDAPITDFNGMPLPFLLDPEGDGLRYDPENPRIANIDGPNEGDPVPYYFDITNPLATSVLPRVVANDPSRLAARRNRIDDSLVEENTYIPKVDVQWDTDNFFGTGNSGYIKAGFKYFSRHRIIDDNSYRPVFCLENADPVDCISDEDVGVRPTPADFPNSTVPSNNTLGVYDTGFQLSFAPFNESMGGTNPTASNTLFPFVVNEVESAENNIEDDYDIDEKILSLYGMASVDVGEKLTLMGGVRVEMTDVEVAANQFTAFFDFEDDFGSNPPCDTFVEGVDSYCLEKNKATFSYDDVFPNVQLTYRITENLQLRMAYTGSIGRPNFEDTAPVTRMETTLDEDGVLDEVRARVRNPSLVPYLANNYDISLEYYTDWGAAFSVAGFHKEIDNPIYSFESRDRDYSDPDDGFLDKDPNGDGMLSTVADAALVIEDKCACTVDLGFLNPDDLVNEVRIEGIENADHGRVTGIEFAATIPFTFLPEPLDGFGFDGNASFISSEVDIKARAGQGVQDPFFEQPGQIMNAAIWYQKGRFQGRVAVRYQSESFDEVDDPASQFTDRYEAEREQWDAQASYRLNDHWSVYFNVNNFTDQRDIRWFGRNPNRLNTVEQFGSVWRFGVRWNY